ncbi:MAG: class I SAM-dependent methyltransferase [Gammaproteobacteria bacterium]|nr:class I SAM-dependent methyltransferase [Gammaproteobacteria bacterium]
MWDERYATDDYVYGTEPNGFLAANVARLPRGDVLCLAEGEGRNAVWLARQGFRVTAVDASAVGLAKAQRLAEKNQVHVETVHADLAHYDLGSARWDAIVSIFCHLPPPLRARVHASIAEALKPGGVFLLEAYTPAQLRHGTGGPPVPDLMMTLDGLRSELPGLSFQYGIELERDIHEGRFHHGRGAVVQVIATRLPQAQDRAR